jgi:hypothetical protein
MTLFKGFGWSRGRVVAVVVVSVVSVVVLWSPAGAHDGTTSHLWASHIKTMADPGTINAATNPVHWTKLKGVPPGFADGVDNNAPAVGFGLRYGDFGILSIDTTETQRRVDNSCPTGQAIRSVGSTGSVSCAAGPRAFAATAVDSDIICNSFCTEGKLSLPAGTYSITAKIGVSQNGDDEILRVMCRLSAGGKTDEAFVNLLGIGTFNGDTVIPLQLLTTLSAPGDVLLTCRDFDVGDVEGSDVSLIAIQVSG